MAYTTPLVPQFESFDDLSAFLSRELQRIAESQSETIAVELRPIFAPPQNPREGMIVFADGVTWNPGAGAGSYEYRGGAWVKL